jgi:hypothetical protein
MKKLEKQSRQSGLGFDDFKIHTVGVMSSNPIVPTMFAVHPL